MSHRPSKASDPSSSNEISIAPSQSSHHVVHSNQNVNRNETEINRNFVPNNSDSSSSSHEQNKLIVQGPNAVNTSPVNNHPIQNTSNKVVTNSVGINSKDHERTVSGHSANNLGLHGNAQSNTSSHEYHPPQLNVTFQNQPNVMSSSSFPNTVVNKYNSDNDGSMKSSISTKENTNSNTNNSNCTIAMVWSIKAPASYGRRFVKISPQVQPTAHTLSSLSSSSWPSSRSPRSVRAAGSTGWAPPSRTC